MRKIITVMLMVGLIWSLAGCAIPEDTNNAVDGLSGIAVDSYTASITDQIIGSILDQAADTNAMMEDRSTTKYQQVEIYLPGIEEPERVIEDNHYIISIFQRNLLSGLLSWKYCNSLPDGTEELMSYLHRQEDLDSPLPSGERPLLEVENCTLYRKDGQYYLSQRTTDGDESSEQVIQIPNNTGNYLLELAGLKTPLKERVEAGNLLPRAGITYDGIAAVSKHQRLETLSADGHLLRQTTDLQEIYIFYQAQLGDQWKGLGQIPQGARCVGQFARYAQPRHTPEAELTEQYRDKLYQDANGYYLEIITVGMVNSDLSKYKIPDEAGAAMIAFVYEG